MGHCNNCNRDYEGNGQCPNCFLCERCKKGTVDQDSLIARPSIQQIGGDSNYLQQLMVQKLKLDKTK